MKIMLYSLVATVLLAVVGVSLFLQHPKFGRLPNGEHLAAIQASPNYVDGEFRNQLDTPLFTEQQSMAFVLIENRRTTSDRVRPDAALPVEDPGFDTLDSQQDMVIWLGHSSYYVQLAGQRLLIDPVFSEAASPVSFINKAFVGTTVFSAAEMPPIDHLLITHDHWDHLDYSSVLSLKPKVGQVACGLGVGSYFRQWGYEPAKVVEGDWYDSVELSNEVTLHFIPARHYSGRALKRNQTLWVGIVLETPKRRLLFSGDSGYGPHFADIARRFGDFDLVVLDQGQYDQRWAYIHMTPEDAAKAAEELGAKALMPAHVGRFALARHAWDEPFQRMAAASAGRGYRLLTPLPGEAVHLSELDTRLFRNWW
ncbi:MBL fold metallo-hydrolase [Pseudomaricurvus sp. HS19]|uniref:MBL fold metallo-hydrolase n=1 Tax=Pseudomaricurvus sp. HS19 TaxID=2692626 RepID=UPI00136C0800|nr:MBL fold metallo-hydrolase [Pseudomaricurvus sp. HS19]MYM61893.1 MBL fold metallo-hydrolase [Pseudomaricurvus sp. HS19]